jgi:hypothetical protein
MVIRHVAEERSFVSLALGVLLLAGCSSSSKGPLYADPSGWSIVSERSGEWWIEGYATMRKQRGQMYDMVQTSGQLRIFDVIYEHITGICEGDTVRYASQNLLFSNWGSMYGRPVPGNQVWSTRDVPVVVTAGRFLGPFKPENGNVVVAGKFDFGDRPPERIIRCDVSGVEP